MSCFSIPKNWEKLKKIEWTEDNVKFKGIQGIRFYNMIIVVVTHATLRFCAGPITNTKFTESVFEKFSTIFLVSGPYGVSTFFQISAMLLTYNIWKQFDEKSSKVLNMKTILLILLNRYSRLTPSLGLILILHSTVLNFVGRGPLWNQTIGIDRRNCRKSAIWNLLFLGNWIKPSDMCLIETWYLSVDMQGFILILFTLYFTMRRPKRFWFTLIGLWFLNVVYMAYYLYRESLFHYLRPYPENLYLIRGIYANDGLWIKTLAYTPMNLTSTFIGAALGYIIYKYEKMPPMSAKTSFFMWTFAIYGVALGIIVLPGMWFLSENYYDSYWFSIPYITLGPTIYSLALALGIFALVSGYGWVTKWVIEWPPTYYLGRVSYTTYLAHYSLVFYILASNKTLSTISEFSIILEAAEVLVMSLIFGLIISLFVEYPISAVTSLYIKPKSMNEKNTVDVDQKTK